MIEDIENDFLSRYSHIYLYGAGKYGAALLEKFTNEGVFVEGFLITGQIENRSFMGKPVCNISEISFSANSCGIVLALGSKYHSDVKKVLNKYEFKNYYAYTDTELETLSIKLGCLTEDILNNYKNYLPIKLKYPICWDDILVLRLDGIGDVVLNTPFLRELRRNHPGSRITLIVAPATYNLMETCPYVDQVIVYNWRLAEKCTIRWRIECARKFMENTFQGSRFDVVLLPRFDGDGYDASLLALFSAAPFRIAYSEKVRPLKAVYNKNYDKLFSRVISVNDVKHEAERNISMLVQTDNLIGSTALELWETSADRQAAMGFLSRVNGFMNRIFIAVGIGASSKEKRWFVEGFIEAMKILYQDNNNLCFVLIGGDDALKTAECIQNRLTNDCVINLVSKTTLRQLVGVMRYTLLYFGNDTGPMHIAAACGCRVLEISRFPKNGDPLGMAFSLRFSPRGENIVVLRPNEGIIDCNEEYCNSINTILPNEVILAIKKLLC